MSDDALGSAELYVPPASSTFFVPVVLSAGGFGGSFFTSELILANRSANNVTVEFDYTAAFGGGTGQAANTLEAGKQRIASDAIAYLRQLGIPIPESGSHGGTLRVRVSGLASPSEGAVISVPLRPSRRPSRPGLSGGATGHFAGGYCLSLRVATRCFKPLECRASKRRRHTGRRYQSATEGVFW